MISSTTVMRNGAEDNAAERRRRQIGLAAAAMRAMPVDEHHDARQRSQHIGDKARHDQHLAEIHQAEP